MSFTFKHFHIDDTNCAMKVGTDGVLLGAYANLCGVRSILDVGAGSGLVSLMLAQRSTPDTTITAVELDSGAYSDCVRNFVNSPWADRLTCINADFKSVEGSFDLIISNPPFFTGSLAAKGETRTLARQGDTLNAITLVEYASRHLTDTGKLLIITDLAKDSDIVFAAEMAGLKLTRLCYIKSKTDRIPFRVIMEFARNDCKTIERQDIVIRNADGSWHDDYIELTKEYYLKL